MMKKLDNRGFAVTVVLYTSATIIVLVLILILSVLSTNNKNTLDLTDMVKEQVSGVTGTTYQLHNLISNGSFESGAASWSRGMLLVPDNTLWNQINSTTFRSGGKSLYISPNGWQWQRINSVNPGDKLYLGSYVYVSSIRKGEVSVFISYNSEKATGGQYGTSAPRSSGSGVMARTTNGFEKLSAIYTVPADPEIFVEVGSSNGASNDVTAYVDDIFVVNLTSVFGAGKEPSLDWCDANLKYFNSVISLTVFDE